MAEELNEDCGCNGQTESTGITRLQDFQSSNDPLVGRKVSLIDGRTGKIDDSIKNSRNEVIGYVIEGDKGPFRVFKDKIAEIDESGAMAGVQTTAGMGNVAPPQPGGGKGSGDYFPTLDAGTPAAKKKEKAKKKEQDKPKEKDNYSMGLMDWKAFSKSMKTFQNDTKK